MAERGIFLGGALAIVMALPALADEIAVYDQSGQKTTISTDAIKGCQVIFDSTGTPFELCRMEKIELRPPQSTRARPGHGSPANDVSVIYTKKTSQ